MLTQSGASVTPRITSFLKETAKQLWGTGAVIADLKSWGNRALAYRIRQKAVNHYHAQYIGLHVYCSPKALQGLEGAARPPAAPALQSAAPRRSPGRPPTVR